LESNNLLEYVLPGWVVDHFEVVKVDDYSSKLEISLEEYNTIPKEYESDRLESKGFLPPIHLEDFPLRGRSVLLKVRRRKWYNHSRNKSVTRDWKLSVQGTSYTEEFAIFLKEVLR